MPTPPPSCAGGPCRRPPPLSVAAAAASEEPVQLAVEIAPELLEIGRTLVAAAGAPAPLRIVERHQHARSNLSRALPEIVAEADRHRRKHWKPDMVMPPRDAGPGAGRERGGRVFFQRETHRIEP